MRRAIAACIGALSALAPLASQPVRAQTNLSVYTGSSFTSESDLRLRQPGSNGLTFHGSPWGDKPFPGGRLRESHAPYYGVRLTHYPRRRPDWGLALDFLHYKVFSNPDARLPVTGERSGAPVGGEERLGDTIQQLDMTHGVNYLTLNAVRRWRLRPEPRRYPMGRLQPYVGVGVGAVIPYVEASLGGRFAEGYQWRGPGYQGFVGVSYGTSKRWSVFGEYKHTQAALTIEVPGGDVRTAVRTHHLILGVSHPL